jgi:arylsulfatase A-like enzyme
MTMSWQGEVFKGKIGFTMEDSTPHWNLPPRPPAGSPNVLMIVLDDVGYGHLGCYGSPIETPNIDALAARGLRYTNWHTTAMCSPTRSCLLTGRNHHSNGMGMISELASGYPGYDGMPKPSRAYISELLQAQGFATFALGKWHQVPAEEMSTAGPYTRWPVGKGFDRYYGFLGAETDQFSPDLVYDNHYIEPPKTAEEGYHLTEDLTDQAIAFLRDLRSADPAKPFFMYFCPGATHAPHQAPREWIEKYQSKFDAGWDAYREETHQRQLKSGILPPGTELSPRPDWVKAWDTLSADEKKLYAHMMEIFAGFLGHTDFHIGRLVQALDKLGDLENTLVIVVSDNGASGEGGYFGSFNENLIFNGVPDTFEENFKRIDELGGPNSYGHYPTGWTMAGNTPFKRWKRNVFNGGIADPMIRRGPPASRRAARSATSTRTRSMCRQPYWTCSTSNRPPCSTACRKKPSRGPVSNPRLMTRRPRKYARCSTTSCTARARCTRIGGKWSRFIPCPVCPAMARAIPICHSRKTNGNCMTPPRISPKCMTSPRKSRIACK